jgi:UDP-N-acetylmuramoyl-L-alanyl-D-glutamate--2,6-diaminopimelate ligase
MMRILNDILSNVSIIESVGNLEVEVNSLQIDSRKVTNSDCFIAIKGTQADGHSYIDTVIAKGASTIVCQEMPLLKVDGVTYIKVNDTAQSLGQMADLFYGSPSSNLVLVGVTGTNGKTSVATLLYQLFTKLGNKVGLISTVENKIGEEVIFATHTTPDAIAINALMDKMVAAGCAYCFMEVSSHAIDQKRIAGLQFRGAIFTNITHDHLDYHKTFDNYLRAKKVFFDMLPKSAFAISNADDRNGAFILQNTQAKKLFYSLRTDSQYKTKIIDNAIYGLEMEIDGVDMHSLLIGEFNAYNLTAVYATAIELEEDKIEVMRILSEITPPAGRFQQIISKEKRVVGIVDYAHTPDALKNVLHTIRAIKNDHQQLITVVGCGGDRDKAKRPLMAAVAAHLSDRTILTADNPRSENPDEIIDEMYAGVDIVERKKVLKQVDRKEAIRTSLQFLDRGDILLIAGKGHEDYQEIKGVKYPFDDREILIELFNEYQL